MELYPITTQIDPALRDAMKRAREEKKIPPMRRFLARAIYDALPPAFRKGVVKP